MAAEIIRIGFVGAGSNTRLRHLPGFSEIDGVELASVSNRTRESSQRVAEEYGIPHIYDNWNDLIESSDSDAICIGTWPYMHCSLVLSALENDKHVLTEARMAMNAVEARIMLDAALQKPELVAQIVPAPHTLAVDKVIKDKIADGYLGDILSVDISVHQGDFIDWESPFHWRDDRDLSGYNIMRLGIWYEAMMRWLGPAESVTAITKIHVKSRDDGTGGIRHITIPDHVEILCEMASGPLVHIRHSAVVGLAPADSAWFFGTEGTLYLDAGGMKLFGGRRGDETLSQLEIPPSKRGVWRVEEEFINAIRGIEPITHTDFYDGVRYMEFTEAVTRSAQLRKAVHLPL